MANEFSRPEKLLCFHFTIANVAADGITDGVLAGGNGKIGVIVPTGYEFVPVSLDVELNDDRTAGTATIKVTADGSELANAPSVLIDDDPVAAGTDVEATADVVAAGEEIGVSATGSATWAPETADADVVLWGYLQPA